MKESIICFLFYCLFGVFWLTNGLFLAPLWLLIAVVGASLRVFEWRETPRVFWDLVMVRWFWEMP